jgi:hypothetical protein
MRREMSYPVAHCHDSPGDDVMVFSTPRSDIPAAFTSLKVVILVSLLCRHYAKRRRATWDWEPTVATQFEQGIQRMTVNGCSNAS